MSTVTGIVGVGVAILLTVVPRSFREGARKQVKRTAGKKVRFPQQVTLRPYILNFKTYSKKSLEIG